MRFTYLWPWWAVVLALAIMASITVYGYLRLNRPLSQRFRVLLIGLRIFAALVLLICLLEPVLIERKDITPANKSTDSCRYLSKHATQRCRISGTTFNKIRPCEPRFISPSQSFSSNPHRPI